MVVSEIIQERAAQSGHWYDKDGKPAYTIIGKNGKERHTTLRDARKLGLVPSVTQIIKESNKPGLISWKEQQVLLAALTMPLIAGETEKEYVARIKADARVQASNAAERGTQIHAWIQQGVEGQTLSGEGHLFYVSAWNEIRTHCGKQSWTCEQPFRYERFGGKIDLNCADYLIDIKTKEHIEDVEIYDEHAMQIAAYQRGINHKGKGGTLFVSTIDKTAKILWIDPDKLERGLKMFNALTDYYYARTGLLV
jgi:hypothetical protein